MDRLQGSGAQPSAAAAVSRRPRRRTAAGRGLVALAACLLSLLAAEGFLRLFTEQGFTLLIRDRTVGKRYRPGVAAELYVPEAGRRVFLRFNRDGFRGPDRPHRAAPGVRRVAVLGDSFIAGVGVEEAETFVDRLGRRLDAGWQGRWEALSFGASGYSTAQSLLVWRHFARAYRPEVVLLGVTLANDLSDNCRCLSTYPRPYFDLGEDGRLVLRPMSAARTAVSRWLGESRLYTLAKTGLRKASWRLDRKLGNPARGLLAMETHPPPPSAEAWRITEALVARLRDEVEADGARFMAFTIPHPAQYQAGLWRSLLEPLDPAARGGFDPDYPDRRLGEIFARRRVLWLPLLPAFREARAGGLLNLVDGTGHWNRRGNDLAAEEVHRALERSGWLAPRRAAAHGPEAGREIDSLR